MDSIENKKGPEFIRSHTHKPYKTDRKKKKEIKQIHSEFDLEKRNMKIMIIVVFDETIRGEKLRNQKSNTIYESQNHHHHHHQPPTTTTYELNGVRETIGF